MKKKNFLIIEKKMFKVYAVYRNKLPFLKIKFKKTSRLYKLPLEDYQITWIFTIFIVIIYLPLYFKSKYSIMYI